MAGRLFPAMALPETPMDVATNDADQQVRHFRQILMWPLQLMPLAEGGPFQNHSQLLDRIDADNPWRELADEFSGDPDQFHERHYSEFVTFLPHVQRFLYGEGGGQMGSSSRHGESPIRVFRRHDVAKVRMHYKDREQPIDFDVAHLDLYFFYDIESSSWSSRSLPTTSNCGRCTTPCTASGGPIHRPGTTMAAVATA